MEGASCTSRRKACDLCVSRKIKCDSLKPTCTNCRLYGAECKITPTAITNTAKKRARARSTERAAISATSTASSLASDRVDALEARLANIESYLKRPVTAQARASDTITIQNRDSEAAISISTSNSDCATASAAFAEQIPGSNISLELELPPLSEVLPNVDNYFKNYNQLTPLFDEPSFMRMLLELYSSPNKRLVVPWAAVNVVLALNYRVLEGYSMDDPKLSTCFHNVQSTMADLMIWQEDLLGLQVLLGMVIVAQGCVDPQLSIVLMGSAIRIAQRMRLSSKQALSSYSPAAALHRRRLFWVAYILDRDLALRAHSPYIQLDSETDLDIPEEDADDDIGIIWLAKGNVRFNYFRARVQLAFIQGKAHDLFYSQRAHNLNQQQRQSQISRIEHMLYDWQKNIPAVFHHAENIRQPSLSSMPAQLMTNIFFRHLECLFRIHSVFSFDITWISRVMRYLSPAVIELGDEESDGEVIRSDLTPLPVGWQECVKNCRRCLVLSSFNNKSDYSVWLHACGTFSSLIVLTVNMIEFPGHNLITEDRKLIEDWRERYMRMGLENSREHFEMIDVLEQLDRRARGQVKRIAQANDNVTRFSELIDEELLTDFDWPTSINMDL